MTLTRSEADRLRSIKTRIDREHLPTFIPSVTRHYRTPWHLGPLMSLLEEARTKGGVRAVVSTPPRHGKTETVLHALAHRVYRQPRLINAYVTYADRLAKQKSRTARRITGEAGVNLTVNSLAEWRTQQLGGVVATSIGGPFTGIGVTGTMVVDDPLKGRKEAESGLVRETTWDWFNDVAYTRLEPGASCIVIATRWHMDDLSGRLLKEDPGKWRHINLPAIDDEGRALWPEQYPVSLLEEIRKQVGEYTWASLYQGRPRPKGGQLFMEPAVYETPTWPMRLVIVCDPAATAKTHSDYTAIGVLGFRGHGLELEADLLEVVRLQVTIPDIVAKLLELQEKWAKMSATGVAPILVEAVGGFKAVPQMLRAIDPSLDITEIAPDTDKFTRAQPAAAAWNRGRIRLPMTAPWLSDFKREMQAFTGINDVEDDQVDMLCHGWNFEHERVGIAAEYQPPEPSERAEFFDEDTQTRFSLERRLRELAGWRL